jgi:hypothetical protein
MNVDELNELVKGKAIFSGAYKNTPEDVAEVRAILKASFEHKEFPYYSEFEQSWNLLEQSSNHDIIEREQIHSKPLDFFLWCVESGFYPPPELLIVIASCFRAHIISGGKTDLSEVFFGKDKQYEHSFDVPKFMKYMDFKVKWVKEKSGSLQVVAEQYLLHCTENNDDVFNDSIDVESFLRGYRRWKNDLKTHKYGK